MEFKLNNYLFKIIRTACTAIFALSIIIGNLQSQNKARVVSAEKALKDFHFMKEVLLTYHPGLYKYQDESTVRKIIDEYADRFEHNLTVAEYYIDLSQFLSELKCGHTQLNPFNQKDSTVSSLFSKENKLPFTVDYREGQLLINRVIPNLGLSRGDIILSMNGIPASTIVDSLLSVARADGNNDYNRYARIETFGDGSYEHFDNYWPMFFPVRKTALLKIENSQGKICELEIDLMGLDQRTLQLQQSYPSLSKAEHDLWQFELLNDYTAYLKLGSYTVWNFEFDWRQFISGVFTQIDSNNVENLIIDIRGNEGGDEIVIRELGKYLHTDSVLYTDRPGVVKYQQIPEDYKPYFRTWNEALYDIRFLTKPYEGGYFVRADEDFKEKYLPAAVKPFQGDQYYLIDQHNSSATFNHALLVQRNQLGTTFGQPTGGNLRGITGGYMFFVTLPNTGIVMDLPLSTIIARESDPDRGIIPDILVEETIDALRNNIDITLQKALSIID